MSRIGRKPVIIPANVTVDIAEGNVVTVKGPKGTLTYTFHPDMILKVEGNEVHIIRVLYGRRNFMQILFGKSYDSYDE